MTGFDQRSMVTITGRVMPGFSIKKDKTVAFGRIFNKICNIFGIFESFMQLFPHYSVSNGELSFLY